MYFTLSANLALELVPGKWNLITWMTMMGHLNGILARREGTEGGLKTNFPKTQMPRGWILKL